jgi:hypothetical protein
MRRNEFLCHRKQMSAPAATWCIAPDAHDFGLLQVLCAVAAGLTVVVSQKGVFFVPFPKYPSGGGTSPRLSML